MIRRMIVPVLILLGFLAGTYAGSIWTIYNAIPVIVNEHCVDIDFGYRIDQYYVE